jgi:hypothetical protein
MLPLAQNASPAMLPEAETSLQARNRRPSVLAETEKGFQERRQRAEALGYVLGMRRSYAAYSPSSPSAGIHASKRMTRI